MPLRIARLQTVELARREVLAAQHEKDRAGKCAPAAELGIGRGAVGCVLARGIASKCRVSRAAQSAPVRRVSLPGPSEWRPRSRRQIRDGAAADVDSRDGGGADRQSHCPRRNRRNGVAPYRAAGACAVSLRYSPVWPYRPLQPSGCWRSSPSWGCGTRRSKDSCSAPESCGPRTVPWRGGPTLRCWSARSWSAFCWLSCSVGCSCRAAGFSSAGGPHLLLSDPLDLTHHPGPFSAWTSSARSSTGDRYAPILDLSSALRDIVRRYVFAAPGCHPLCVAPR